MPVTFSLAAIRLAREFWPCIVRIKTNQTKNIISCMIFNSSKEFRTVLLRTSPYGVHSKDLGKQWQWYGESRIQIVTTAISALNDRQLFRYIYLSSRLVRLDCSWELENIFSLNQTLVTCQLRSSQPFLLPCAHSSLGVWWTSRRHS